MDARSAKGHVSSFSPQGWTDWELCERPPWRKGGAHSAVSPSHGCSYCIGNRRAVPSAIHVGFRHVSRLCRGSTRRIPRTMFNDFPRPKILEQVRPYLNANTAISLHSNMVAPNLDRFAFLVLLACSVEIVFLRPLVTSEGQSAADDTHATSARWALLPMSSPSLPAPQGWASQGHAFCHVCCHQVHSH